MGKKIRRTITITLTETWRIFWGNQSQENNKAELRPFDQQIDADNLTAILFSTHISDYQEMIMSTRCPELASIRKVVDLYIDGVQNGNLDAMRQAFHPQSSMFGYKGKDLFITPIQGLYDYIASTTPPAKAGALGKAYTCTITGISVVGNAASVEMAMDGYHEHDFTDYFQLLKVDGRWWIVSKLFHADPQSK